MKNKEEQDQPVEDSEDVRARRDFLKKAGTIGMTAPAVTMLLSANAKVQADQHYSAPTPQPEPTPPPPP